MGLESQLAAVRSLIESDPDAVGFIDRATVYSRSEAADGYGGSTVTETAVASNVKCLYEEDSDSSSQVAGGPTSYVTHKIYLIASSAVRQIVSDYKIVIASRGDMPSLTFERPVVLDSTFDPIVVVGAKVKK